MASIEQKREKFLNDFYGINKRSISSIRIYADNYKKSLEYLKEYLKNKKTGKDSNMALKVLFEIYEIEKLVTIVFSTSMAMINQDGTPINQICNKISDHIWYDILRKLDKENIKITKKLKTYKISALKKGARVKGSFILEQLRRVDKMRISKANIYLASKGLFNIFKDIPIFEQSIKYKMGSKYGSKCINIKQDHIMSVIEYIKTCDTMFKHNYPIPVDTKSPNMGICSQIDKKPYFGEAFISEDHKQFIDKASKVKWRINKEVLDIINYHNSYSKSKPFHGFNTEFIDINEAKNNLDKALILQNNTKAKNEILTLINITKEANEFKDKVFTFDWKCDYRGRFYPRAGYLNPQGSDLSKALLSLDEPIEVTNREENHLIIHFMNLAGFDKRDYKDKIAIFNDIYRHRINLMSFYDFSKTKNCFQLFVTAMELRELFKKGKVLSRIPIQHDLSCNAMQYLASFFGDKTLLELTNLDKRISSRSDVYNKMKELLENELRDIVTSSNYLEDFEYAIIIKRDTVINRDLAKRITMTFPYGITVSGIRDICKNHIKDGNFACSKDEQFKDVVSALVRLCLRASKRLLGNLDLKIKALKKEVKELLEDSKYLYILKNGVRQARIDSSYIDTYRAPFLTMKGDKIRKDRCRCQEIHDRIDIRKTLNGLIANIIHCIDSNLCIEMSKESYFIYSIHDCFCMKGKKPLKESELISKKLCDNIYNNTWELEFSQKTIKLFPDIIKPSSINYDYICS